MASRRGRRSWPGATLSLALAVLIVVGGLNLVVSRARATGLDGPNGVNYVYGYSVSSSGGATQSSVGTGTLSTPSYTMGALTISRYTGTNQWLEEATFTLDGYASVYLSYQYNGTNYWVNIAELISNTNSSTKVAILQAVYTPGSGNTLPTNVGDLYATNISTSDNPTIGDELSDLGTALSSVATSYSDSSNSTIKHWGEETSSISSALGDYKAMLPSGVGSTHALGTYMFAQTSTGGETNPQGPGEILACALAILALAYAMWEIGALAAACGELDIVACYEEWFVATIGLPAAVLAVIAACSKG
jgi:hypothetical protein